MLRKLFTILLVVSVINLAGVRLAYAESKEEKHARFAEKIKANVIKLGTGESTRVKVKLPGWA
jgi:L-ribulose-5-phosphate 3-epimerase UlaE